MEGPGQQLSAGMRIPHGEHRRFLGSAAAIPGRRAEQDIQWLTIATPPFAPIERYTRCAPTKPPGPEDMRPIGTADDGKLRIITPAALSPTNRQAGWQPARPTTAQQNLDTVLGTMLRAALPSPSRRWPAAPSMLLTTERTPVRSKDSPMQPVPIGGQVMLIERA